MPARAAVGGGGGPCVQDEAGGEEGEGEVELAVLVGGGDEVDGEDVGGGARGPA